MSLLASALHGKSTDVAFKKRPMVLAVLEDSFTALPRHGQKEVLSALSLLPALSLAPCFISVHIS